MRIYYVPECVSLSWSSFCCFPGSLQLVWPVPYILMSDTWPLAVTVIKVGCRKTTRKTRATHNNWSCLICYVVFPLQQPRVSHGFAWFCSVKASQMEPEPLTNPWILVVRKINRCSWENPNSSAGHSLTLGLPWHGTPAGKPGQRSMSNNRKAQQQWHQTKNVTGTGSKTGHAQKLHAFQWT